MARNEIDQAVQKLVTMTGKKVEIKKIWENASPASAFGVQSIKLSGVKKGNIIGVECYTQNNSVSREMHLFKAEVGAELLMTNIGSTSDGAEPYLVRRQALLESLTSLKFGTGYLRYFSANNKANNNYAIPSGVYVMKGVI